MGTFGKIEAGESAVEACVEAVRERILAGRIAAGDRLPPERELAATLGVNRLTLRSALARLSASNLLHVRQGSGYVVRPWRRDGGPDLLAGLLALAHGEEDRVAMVRDLLAVRRQLAAAVLERLAEGVEAGALAEIEVAVARFASLAENDAPLEALVEADLDALRAVASATGSPVFALCINPVAAVLRSMPALSQASLRAPRENVLGYRALLAWLAAPSRQTLPGLRAVLEARDAATLEAYAVLVRAPKRDRRRS